ncbi:MAG: hypothetical protein M3503_06395, partial [Actinomycetota bacterium]|nr:hypothetical protein [Actinomycetota bacterium]
CGSGDGGGAAAGTTTTGPGAGSPEAGGALSLLRVFALEQAAGIPLRLPLAFADAEGAPTDDVPDAITVTAVSPSGVAGQPVEVPRHGDGIPTPYFPFEGTLDEPGTWELAIAVGEAETRTDLTVRPPEELAVVPGPGDVLPSIPTPTTVDALGVQPICTANPPCPLHDVSLDQALAVGLPIVLLVSTPAFCQTAICGPVLDLVVARRRELEGRATLLHAEVYTDDRADETTATVNALGLRYEPSLFLTAADGTVRGRLDYTFDATELDDQLGALLAS